MNGSRTLLAYLDPGSGGMIIQIVVGGVAALGVMLKIFWHRLTRVFRRRRDT